MSADLLLKTPTDLNPLKDREMSLRGLQIPAIENLGVTRDQIESLDLSDNAITSLSNLPRLLRVRHLIFANNPIAAITPALASQLPGLESVVLSGTKLADLKDLDPLAACKHLEFLSLIGAPVTEQQHYRHWVIHRCRKVRVLDFQRVKDADRKQAAALFVVPGTGEPTELAQSISSAEPTVKLAGTKTFTPGEINGHGKKLTDEDRARIRKAIENASTVEEIRLLKRQLDEGCVRLGLASDASSFLPDQL